MKLQINSLEALERLIGGDTEIEVDVRNNIVEAFAKKYLKSIVQSANFSGLQSRVLKDLEAEVDAAVAKEVGTVRRAYQGAAPTVQLRDAIRSSIQTAVVEVIKPLVENATAEFTSRYTTTIQAMVDKAINAEFQKRVDAAVEARLKEIAKKIG